MLILLRTARTVTRGLDITEGISGDVAVVSNAAGSDSSPQSAVFSKSPGLHHRDSQVSADYKLHPLTLFRVIRNQVPEKHAPEKLRNPNLPINGDALSPSFSWAAPFLTGPADFTVQQLQNDFWDLDDNSSAWINANVQDNEVGMSADWYI